MPEVMLRPNWPGGRFARTITGKKGRKRRIEFLNGQPVEVSDDEFLSLIPDIGAALFEVARDEKGRTRLLEPETAQDKPAANQPEG